MSKNPVGNLPARSFQLSIERWFPRSRNGHRLLGYWISDKRSEVRAGGKQAEEALAYCPISSRNRFSMRRKAAAVGSHRPRIAFAPAASYPSSGRGRRVTKGGRPYLIARKFAQSRGVRPLPFAKG